MTLELEGIQSLADFLYKRLLRLSGKSTQTLEQTSRKRIQEERQLIRRSIPDSLAASKDGPNVLLKSLSRLVGEEQLLRICPTPPVVVHLRVTDDSAGAGIKRPREEDATI